MDEQTQQEIFDSWLKTHKGIFFKVVRAYGRSHHDQEDLFQEVALQVWKSIPDFREEAKPSTWIYRVALFTALSWVRNEEKQPDADSITDREEILAGEVNGMDPKLNWLYEQIGKLEPLDRSICLLMLEGYRYREIAEMTGLTESNVGVKIHRIKQHLIRQQKTA